MDAAIHIAIIVLSSLDAYNARHSWDDAWFFEAAWSVIQPLFWAVALALRRADRAAVLPARANAQVCGLVAKALLSSSLFDLPSSF